MTIVTQMSFKCFSNASYDIMDNSFLPNNDRREVAVV